ncbi:hypothetical protein RS24_01952 [Candidatus Micropelagos thuwalensis]|uniref:Uncharacterized protein n=1 Tax=Candidatus Micropelagius thuwalensis TaxID=1397666 RepID=U2XTD8_9PROT|nr:hypothetical protein RS24_01952 [Candidatus Micropelagos thuwalensis]
MVFMLEIWIITNFAFIRWMFRTIQENVVIEI